MVMGRDTRSKGCGFKSQHHILDGHFFTYICCKNCNVCLKRPKINEKEAGVGRFFNTQGPYFAILGRVGVSENVSTNQEP